MITLPAAYEGRMRALLGDGFAAYAQALEQKNVRAFRVNTEKISLADFEALGSLTGERIPYVENGFYLTEEHIGDHPFHHAGMIYVQEPAAMAPVECLPIQPDWRVLDMCAAPGGKSTQLKNKLGENGVLVSNEIIPARCRILTGNIERLGLKNTVTTCLDTGRLADLFPHTFDLITVDAPCSGEGMFRKEENAIPEWSEDNVQKCAARQAEILDNAVRALQGGGYIVYATCTFSPEENEMTVDAFLRRHPEFVLCPVTEAVKKCTEPGIAYPGCTCENICDARRFYPHTGRGEGQFMAVLHSTAEPRLPKKAPPAVPVCRDPAVLSFLAEVLGDFDPAAVRLYNGNPVWFPTDFPVPAGAAFCCGVTIGEVRKNYVQPHHQFFMALGNRFSRRIDLAPDSDLLRRYLHGEEIPADCENGWAAVTVAGCTLGGAKVVDGRAKNHYPKGLRIQ